MFSRKDGKTSLWLGKLCSAKRPYPPCSKYSVKMTLCPPHRSRKSCIWMAVEWSQLEALFQGVRYCIQNPYMPESCASLPFSSCTPVCFQAKLSISSSSIHKPYKDFTKAEISLHILVAYISMILILQVLH